MTTATDREDGESARISSEDRPWSGTVVAIAHELAHPNFKRGDLADLRHMKPGGPDPPVFFRLLAHHALLEDRALGPGWERKWALILHGLALMTPTCHRRENVLGAPWSSAHNPRISVGLALFVGGDPSRERAFYSESRLNRLLCARGPILHSLLARTFRMMGADRPFDWREMSALIFQEGHDDDAADRIRYGIARSYFQAERRADQARSSGSV